MNNKVIIFDASTLITLTMNGLLPEFRELKKRFNGKFIITQEVKGEVVDKPLKIKRFELEGLKIKQLIDEGVLEMASSLKIDPSEISKGTAELMKVANRIFRGRGRDIRLIDLGETSCLVLSKLLTERKIENVIALDERTTRMLVEKPENLESLLRKKLHTSIEFREDNFKFFKGFRFIRSSELVYVMWKKGITRLKNGHVLDALLYAVRFKGCSISDEEINEIKRLR